MSKIAGEFVVLVGNQPVMSNKSETICKLYADQLKVKNIALGIDVEAKEHQIKVAQVIVDDQDPRYHSLKF